MCCADYVFVAGLWSYYCLHFTMNIAHHIPEMLICYEDKIMVMGNSENSRVFNFEILLKSRKFDAHEIYVFYSSVSVIKSVTHVARARADQLTSFLSQSVTAISLGFYVRCLHAFS